MTPTTKAERTKNALERRAMLESRPSSYRWELHASSCKDMIDTLNPDSVDWIITDPPYPMQYLPCYEELGALADYALKPGGGMLVMTGHQIQYKVVPIIEEFSQMQYHWTLAYTMSGGTSAVPFRKVGRVLWKPILMFSKGKYGGIGFSDVIKTPYQKEQDRSIHTEWQQSEAGFQEIINKFCFPSDTVLDPFAGSGTTLVCALNRGCTAIGADIDSSLIRKARLRLANHPMLLTTSGVEALGASG